MPFPSTQEAMFATGYEYSRWEKCSVCGLDVEIYITPGKREIAMEPMPSNSSPAIRHYERCNIAPKQEEQSGTANDANDVAGRDGDGGDAGRLGGAASGVARVPRQRETEIRNECPDVLPDGRRDVSGSGIKLYGVTDKNMIAVGWLAGTLKVQFRFGCYLYANVPEDVFTKIRNNPFPNNMFVKIVKSKPDLYPCTKVS